jgi:FkbM family methyltransferase
VFVEKAKTAIKSMPFLYNILLPGVILFRRIQMNRFRRYCSYLPKVVLEPVFVKVGANDGIIDDPCSDILIGNTKWKGLLIEPVPYCFCRLRANFQDVQRFSLEQVAIGATTGEATFYYVDEKARESIPELPWWFDKLGSFDRSHIVKWLNGLPDRFIIESTVEVCTLSDVLKRNGIRDVHLLHIDTEGHDYEVLKTLDFANQSPVVIFVEHKHLPNAQKTEMVRLLRNNGYTVRNCGQDYFALNKEAYKRLQQTALARHG